MKGVFPDSLKSAVVVPIFKPGEKKNPENYRPISLLPSISKIFERAVKKQLRKYCMDNSIIYKH